MHYVLKSLLHLSCYGLRYGSRMLHLDFFCGSQSIQTCVRDTRVNTDQRPQQLGRHHGLFITAPLGSNDSCRRRMSPLCITDVLATYVALTRLLNRLLSLSGATGFTRW
jgi:hypothetical protein